jgi:hypothetical protein
MLTNFVPKLVPDTLDSRIDISCFQDSGDVEASDYHGTQLLSAIEYHESSDSKCEIVAYLKQTQRVVEFLSHIIYFVWILEVFPKSFDRLLALQRHNILMYRF